MISKENAHSLIQKSGTLPTLPAILLKLLEACDNDETSLSEVAALINKDPVLSFKVLQLVNSAYYGFRYSFKGIEQAVIYLGSNTIKNIAVTMSVHQVFERKRFKNIKQFNFNVFWYQSLLCASLAKRIAQKIGFTNIDEAYLSGLLHDIGRLILISTFPKEHETILTKTKDSANTLWAETQLLGVNHCETGSWLIQKWRLSSMMADAVQYHHEPLEKITEAFPLVKIIYVSNLLIENSDDIEETYKAIDLLFGLKDTDVQDLVAGAEEEVEQVAQSLEIKIQRPPDTKSTSPRQVSTNTENNQDTARTLEQSSPPSLSNEAEEHEEALQEALTARIKSVSLLSNFLERLVQAGDIEEIIAAFEQAMSIFFNIEKVLFFLTETDRVLLRGCTSAESSWHQASQGLTLTLQQNSSLIVKTYHDMSMTYLTDDKSTDNLADKQILSTLRCSTVLLVPLIADKKPAGVILLGLPQAMNSLAASDSQLLQVVAQQVGLCLQLENMKTQKIAELEAERMSAVSMTARKVAHEINNPLGIISNYLTAMKFRLSGDKEVQNELTIIDEEIHRISSLIGQIDIFSKDPVHNFELSDVNATIEDIIQLVKSAHFAAPGILISFLPDDTLPQITTSRDAIKQILINLIKNAAESMTNGGSVAVMTRHSAEDMVAGTEGIEIIVADTGPGLPESVTATLYTPFVTTKQNGHSGLGLSIVYKTVKDLGGTLSCKSSPTDGTSFSIFLPHST
ncbi:MAG: HDOD domain-containing protein [Desulfobulbaceae bacterium]|nr:HDOD domain-containing protein [Desulfobulbaceae bacterium]